MVDSLLREAFSRRAIRCLRSYIVHASGTYEVAKIIRTLVLSNPNYPLLGPTYPQASNYAISSSVVVTRAFNIGKKEEVREKGREALGDDIRRGSTLGSRLHGIIRHIVFVDVTGMNGGHQENVHHESL